MRRPLLPLAVLLLLLAWAPPAHAGGGPETTLVVVNQDSPTSWRIANTYARLRGIPATHICPIPAPPNLLTITVDEFRERIWKPIADYMAKHELTDEIDTITYSADFPFGVDYRGDFELKPQESGRDKMNWPPVASLTGVTYLHRHVMAKKRDYLDLMVNRYLRVDGSGEMMPGHGFRSTYAWAREVEPKESVEDPDTMDRYVLSTMLGFTGMQGNTVPEIEAYLTSAAGADGTRPDGTVYLMVNKDVRARTRLPQFDDTEKALARLGAKVARCEQGKDGEDGKCPQGKDDVIGCVAGIAGFNWPSSESRFMPGAIAEHLTSFGAKFDGSGQTKISEYLRAGAAGSSGAVAEPYALWQKFPLATLHVHYREGCSLAESFFQTVAGPYQLLVIGDPLARPYAHFAKVAFEGGAPKTWKGTVAVKARIEDAPANGIRALELWIDGQRILQGAPDEALTLDTTAYPDGEHDVRLVAIEKGPIETRSSTSARIAFDNHGGKVTIKGPKDPTPYGEEIKVTGRSRGAKEIVVVCGHRVLGEAKRISSSVYKCEFDSRLLGEGTSPVQTRVTAKDGTVTLSDILDLEVTAPGSGDKSSRRGSRRKKSGKDDEGKGGGKPGLQVVATDEKGKESTFVAPSVGLQGKHRFLTHLRKHAKGKLKSIRLEGEIEVKEAGTYRLALNAEGALTVKVKGETVFEGEGLALDRQAYAVVALEAGWHAVEITYTPTGTGELSVWLGGDVVSGPLSGKTIRH